MNLVNNAVKFTDKGEIKIECKIENDNLKVCVSDTGIGIKQENMDFLFEAFRQIDGTAQRRYEGAGLGLHLCKKLVTILGGNIWAESEYGKGSKLAFILPLRIKKGNNMNKRILIVEDNEQNLYLATFLLKKSGYEIIAATDGLEAIDKIIAEKPDLVLMDMQLPEMNGYEATKRIKSITEINHIPIVAITSYAMAGDREKRSLLAV